ncbi:MAG: serine/threonine protein kinase [Thermoanaerobaculia bacterium]|nr:serine/threonine protein kinase [Thermoanaerobaculia bacterium]
MSRSHDAEFHRAAKGIFLRAVELEGAARSAFLVESCGEDDELRREVESLLEFSEGATQQTTHEGVGDNATLAESGLRLDTSSPSRSRLEPGSVFGGRFRIIAELGRGGMGRVLRAHDLVLDLEVALKILPEGGSAEQLAQEVRLARQVSHPNVCRVFDFGEADGVTFLSMEYVDGEDLGSLLRRIGRLPREKLLDLSHQLCAGLNAAHAAGILHRDLKPANIMIDGQGRVRITDFGIASGLVRTAEADTGSPQNPVAGTPAYMAPELWEGRPSRASDLYALGLVLFEMATGEQALRAKTPAGFLRLHAEQKPVSSPRLEQVDAAFEEVIRRCLDSNPERRPSSARAVAESLPDGDRLQRALDAGETPSPDLVADASAARAGGLSSRRAAVSSLLVLAVLLGLLFVLGERAFPSRHVWKQRSPEAMAERASSLLRGLGHESDDRHRAWGFRPSAFLDDPDDLFFWYRESPEWLVAWGLSFGVLESRVSYYDPPPIVEGSVQMLLESDGRLVTLKVLTGDFALLSRFTSAEVEAGAISSLSQIREPDWTALHEAVGWKDISFQEVTPQVVPPMYVDRQRAWRADDPQREGEWLLEAASFDGRIVFADVRAVAEPDLDELFEMPLFYGLIAIALQFEWLALWLAAAVLALVNLRSQRGDLRGAARLAVTVSLLRLGRWLLASDHAPPEVFVETLHLGLARSLLDAAFTWLAYLALEPTVRRLWPHTLVAWSRLLRGRWRDVEVARSVLVGCVAGTGWALALVADRLLVRALGWKAEAEVLVEWQLQTATAGRQLAANLFASLVDGVTEGVLVLFLLAVLRGLLGRKRWAILAFAGFQAAVATADGLDPALSWLTLGLAVGLVGTWVLVRAGLLAYATALVVAYLLHTTPITFDFTAWYAESGVWAAASVLATAGFCAVTLFGEGARIETT